LATFLTKEAGNYYNSFTALFLLKASTSATFSEILKKAAADKGFREK
jgi:hypothetical protein